MGAPVSPIYERETRYTVYYVVCDMGVTAVHNAQQAYFVHMM